MSDSEDDLFSDARPDASSSSSPSLTELSVDSHCVSLSSPAPGLLHVTVRHLGDGAASTLALSLWPDRDLSHVLLRLLIARAGRRADPCLLALPPRLLQQLGGEAGEPLIALASPSGHVFVCPVTTRPLRDRVRLAAALGQPLVALDSACVGPGAEPALLAVGRRGRTVLVTGGEPGPASRAFQVWPGSEPVLGAVASGGAVFLAGERLLLRVEITDTDFRPSFRHFRPRSGHFRRSGAAVALVRSTREEVALDAVCRAPEAFLEEVDGAGPTRPLGDTLSALETAAGELGALREEHAKLDRLLAQVNVAAHLRLLPEDQRRALFSAEVVPVFSDHPAGTHLRVEVTNHLDVPLSVGAWLLAASVQLPGGGGGGVAHQRPLTATRRGTVQRVLLAGLLDAGGRALACGRPISVAVDLLLLLDVPHGAVFVVRLLARRLSPLEFVGPPCGVAMATGETLEAPETPEAAAALSVALRPGDRLTGLGEAWDWLTAAGAAGETRELSCLGRRVSVSARAEATAPLGDACRLVTIRCADLRLLVVLWRALGAAVVRRKRVGAEEVKKDLLLLRTLRRAAEASPDEAVRLFELWSALGALHCV